MTMPKGWNPQGNSDVSKVDHLFNKAMNFYNLDKYEECLDCCNKAIEIDPNEVGAWHLKGSALLSLNRYSESLESSEKALETRQDVSTLWTNKGMALIFLGKFEESIDAFNKAIEIDPNEVGLGSLIYMATSFSYLHRYSECLDCCNKALEIDPNEPSALKLKNSCLKAMGL